MRITGGTYRGRQLAAAAAAEGDLDAHPRLATAGGQAQRLGQQRLVDPARRQRQPPGLGEVLDLQRLFLDHRAHGDLTRELRAHAAEPDPRQRARAEQQQRRAGDVERLRVERARDQQEHKPQRRTAEGGAHRR